MSMTETTTTLNRYRDENPFADAAVYAAEIDANYKAWPSHDRTVILAQRLGHDFGYIDDDCFLIRFNKDRNDWLQVQFDNYSATNKLTHAFTNDGTELLSYAAIRKLIIAKVPAAKPFPA